jgi:hypothetical protein
MPFVSITRLRVRRWRYLPQFLIQSFRAACQANRAAGNLAVSVLRDADRGFWTRTLWRDEGGHAVLYAIRRPSPDNGAARRVVR